MALQECVAEPVLQPAAADCGADRTARVCGPGRPLPAPGYQAQEGPHAGKPATPVLLIPLSITIS